MDADAHSRSSDNPKVSIDDSKIPVLEDGVAAETPMGERRIISASTAIDPAAERRLVWKFDLRILPVLAVMYLFNALVSGFLSSVVFNLPASRWTETGISFLGSTRISSVCLMLPSAVRHVRLVPS